MSLHRFGLCYLDGSQPPPRRCQASVLAGPAPVALAPLRERLLRAGEAGQALAAETDGWPASFMQGASSKAIDLVQFFQRSWERLGGTWRDEHPEAFTAIEQLLNQLLHEELNLTPFCPRHFQDHPDAWMRVRTRGVIQTGNVLRVLQPGLQNADGTLRLPAIIEVE
jgi:hypothetical protein